MGLWSEAAVSASGKWATTWHRANWALDKAVFRSADQQGSLFRIVPEASGASYRSSVTDARSAAQRRELHQRMLGSGVVTSPTGWLYSRRS